MEEVMLQNLTKTRAKLDCVWLPLVPRAFLQIFITTTLHHRLAGFGSDRFASTWLRFTLLLYGTRITLIHAGFQSVLAVIDRRSCSTSYAIDSG
jgi:hypothetical protein